MIDRYSRIAAYVRSLDDDDLNDLLVELPVEVYGRILEAVPADVPSAA